MHFFSALRPAILALFLAYELPALFGLILIEEMGLPLPLPGDTLIAYAGSHANHSPLHALVVIVIVALAAAIGSSLLYLFARSSGATLMGKLQRVLHLRPDRVAKMEAWFLKRGATAIILGRLIPGLRTPTSAMAGLAHVPYRVFLPSTSLAAVIWATFYYFVGDALRRSWAPMTAWAGHEPEDAIGLLVFGLLLLAGWFWLRQPRVTRAIRQARATRLHLLRRTWLRSAVRVPLDLLLGMSLILVAAFVKLTEDVRETDTLVADQRYLRLIDTHTAAWPLSVAQDASLLGSRLLITTIALVLCCWLVRRRRWLDTGFLIGAIGGSAIWTTVLKHLIGRPRPHAFMRVSESGYSFPCGHTLSVTCLAVALGFLLWRSTVRRGAKVVGVCFLGLLVVVVGASRLLLGVHYPTDILGSILLGTAWGDGLIVVRVLAACGPVRLSPQALTKANRG